MVNVGIVGLGFMGSTHIKAYRQVPETRLAALCSPSGRRLDGDFSDVTGNVGDKEPLKVDMTGVKAFRDVTALVNDPEIDVVDICSPTVAHHPIALAALKAGKHVVCEKPLTRSSKLAREIVEAAERAKSVFMPAMCMRFWPGWADWLKSAIDQNTYGRVLSATFRRVAEPPAWGRQNFFDGAKSGGGLFDLHIHDTDFVQFCFGRPKSVFSSGYTRFSSAIDHVLTHYEVKSGAIVHAEGSWAMTPGFGFNMSYTVNFENATMDFDLSRGADALRLVANGQPPVLLPCSGPDGYVGELRHFIECVRKEKQPTVVTGRDALSSVEICEAEEKSALTKQVVTL